MIEFVPIMSPAVLPNQQVEPVGEVEEGPSAQDEVITDAAESVSPPFVLEPAASGRSKPARPRSRHISPPATARIIAREEIQLSLGFEELKPPADSGVPR